MKLRLELTEESLRRLAHDICHVRYPDLADARPIAKKLLAMADKGKPEKDMAELMREYILLHPGQEKLIDRVPVLLFALRYSADMKTIKEPVNA